MESYADDERDRIYESWIDGLTTGESGSTVGCLQAPFAERAIVHGGKQSMPSYCDNSKTPYYSQAERELDWVQDWTVNGLDGLSLWFRGNAVRFLETASNAITMSSTSGAVAFPVCLKRERKGNVFTASYSTDGKTWTSQGNAGGGDSPNPETIVMSGNVCVGLAVTITEWTEWKVPLSGIKGISLSKVKAVIIGVGDPKKAQSTGKGLICIDDIRVTRP